MSTLNYLINIFLSRRFHTIFYKYENNREKYVFLNRIFSFSNLFSERIIFVSVSPNLWKLKNSSKNIIKISPYELRSSDLFSILLSFSFKSFVIIDSFPQIVNIYPDGDKVIRSFLYFLAKFKGYAHILVFINLNSKKYISSQPIFNKIFYHKFYNKCAT